MSTDRLNKTGSLDAVAEAIQGALGETYSSPPWKYLSEATKEQYRRRAAAAIEALQLTQEWGVKSGVNDPKPVLSEAKARHLQREWPESFTAASRLVSPWSVGVIDEPKGEQR